MRRLLRVAMSVAGGATLAACGGPNTADLTPPPSAGASGCGVAATAGSVTLGMTDAGQHRIVIVHVPNRYAGSSRVALVLNLHGSGATAADQERFSGMDATADSHGFLVAYPQGLLADGSGYDWNVPGEPLVGGQAVPRGAADDEAFLTHLVTALEARYCIDARRVDVTGFSGGGRMASQLACDASDVFAAAAAVSGLRRPTPCPAARAVPVIAFHGTSDPIDPYDGNGRRYWTYSVPQAAEAWAVQDACQSIPRVQRTSGFSLTSYPGCKEGAHVELYTVMGEGHEWPGGPHVSPALSGVLGPQSDAVDANTVMWSFFARATL